MSASDHTSIRNLGSAVHAVMNELPRQELVAADLQFKEAQHLLSNTQHHAESSAQRAYAWLAAASQKLIEAGDNMRRGEENLVRYLHYIGVGGNAGLSKLSGEVTAPGDTPEEKIVEVTFHLGYSGMQPFRWVGSITTPDEAWSSGQEANQQLEPLIVELPSALANNLLGFARKHIGRNATESQTTYWCHTFAHAVGTTAVELTGDIMGGTQGLADAQARHLSSQGSKILPADLALGEHAVVADLNTSNTPIHSIVGIGRPKGRADGPTLAVQVDSQNGSLYVGDPAVYLEDLRSSRSIREGGSEPALYVQRTVLSVPAKSQ